MRLWQLCGTSINLEGNQVATVSASYEKNRGHKSTAASAAGKGQEEDLNSTAPWWNMQKTRGIVNACAALYLGAKSPRENP